MTNELKGVRSALSYIPGTWLLVVGIQLFQQLLILDTCGLCNDEVPAPCHLAAVNAFDLETGHASVWQLCKVPENALIQVNEISSRQLAAESACAERNAET